VRSLFSAACGVLFALTYAGNAPAQEVTPDTPQTITGQEPVAASTVEPIQVSGDRKKISLDIKNLEVVDVLKMLAQRAGLNIVAGKNARGQVSLFIRDVGIWDAFEIILLANDLAYDKRGDLIYIMTQEEYAKTYGVPYKDKKEIETVRLKFTKAKDLVTSLGQVKSDVGKVIVDESSNSLILMDVPERIASMKEVIGKTDVPLETRIFELNYADPEKLSEKIKPMILKSGGSLKADDRTDKISVTDSPENLAEIERVVRAFDEKPRQVLIDAQIIELKPSDKFEMGVDWDHWMEKYFRVQAPFAGVTGTTKLSVGTVGQVTDELGEYTAVVDALRTLGDTKILSSPRIMVVSGQEARMLVGTKQAYLTSATTQVGESASTSETVNFVDVGIKLYVIPEVSREGFITMKIRPEVSSSELVNFGTSTAPKQIPIVTTSEAETMVVVNNGTTIIIGGLRKDEKIETVKKIPILGDIPLLGVLARSTSREIKTTDLIILLTPHLVSGESSLTDFRDVPPADGVTMSMEKGMLLEERFSREEKTMEAIE
jgi:type II secretory pathway component GspD/PulD (secretin)